MTWREQKDGCLWAYAGKHRIGIVEPVVGGPSDGKAVWQLDLRQGCADTVEEAKGELRAAWSAWLQERGLREAA